MKEKLLRFVGLSSDGIDPLHRLVLRLPSALYIALAILSALSLCLIIQRIFVPNALPTIFWVMDLLLITAYLLSHIRYRIRCKQALPHGAYESDDS